MMEVVQNADILEAGFSAFFAVSGQADCFKKCHQKMFISLRF